MYYIYYILLIMFLFIREKTNEKRKFKFYTNYICNIYKITIRDFHSEKVR